MQRSKKGQKRCHNMAEEEQMGHVQDFKSLSLKMGLYVQLYTGVKKALKKMKRCKWKVGLKCLSALSTSETSP